MKLARTLEKVWMHPWLITPGGYASVMRLIESKLNGEQTSVIAEIPESKKSESPNALVNGIVQITISGILGQRLSFLERICGGCDYMDIAEAIDEAFNSEAQGLLFIFDSPGGMAIGCPECAARIASIDIPTVAFSDSLMTSGAYYLASGCDYIMATPSANVGSIGVIIPWIDKEKMFDKAGLKFDPIYSKGDDLKTTMYGPSLTDEQRDYLQESVDQVAKDFQDHVSTYRSLDFSQLKAGAYAGQKALSLNLIDRIGSLQDAQNELSRRIQKTQT